MPEKDGVDDCESVGETDGEREVVGEREPVALGVGDAVRGGVALEESLTVPLGVPLGVGEHEGEREPVGVCV